MRYTLLIVLHVWTYLQYSATSISVVDIELFLLCLEIDLGFCSITRDFA